MKRILFFVFTILLISCTSKLGEFDPIYHELQKEAPESFINDFRIKHIDSVIIFNRSFDRTFSESLGNILENKSIEDKFLLAIEKEGLNTITFQSKMTLVIGFHKYLNQEKYDLKKIRQEVITFYHSRSI